MTDIAQQLKDLINDTNVALDQLLAEIDRNPNTPPEIIDLAKAYLAKQNAQALCFNEFEKSINDSRSN
jgi:hypothetical protein